MGSDVMQRLGAVAPFDRLDPDVLAGLADDVRVVRLAPDEDLVTAGDEADELYVVLSGSLRIIAPGPDDAPETVLGQLGPGSVVGEIAVLTGGVRSATLRAEEPLEAAAMTGSRFAQLLREHPAIGTHLAAVASSRLRATRFSGQLARLFPTSDRLPVADLVERVGYVALGAGEVLFREGEEADAAYVVVSGRVRVLVDEDGRWATPIAEVGAGELLGEMALLDDERRTATVVAARDSVLARLPRTDFEALVTGHPATMLSVTRTIVARSRDRRESYRRAGSDHAAIGLVPITPGVDLDRLATDLIDRLERGSDARLVTAETLAAELGVPDVAQAPHGAPDELRLARWLDEAEAAHDLLVLQAEREPTAWTRRCVERVDHLVLVADAAEDPEPGVLERALVIARELPHQRVSLVLLHPAGTARPHGTRAWLAARDVDEHHHVRADHPDDLDRLARHLSGRAVTLVLSGGGAKGFAHLGVVSAMRELGIPIDALAGASMGAPLAAAVAIGTPDDELVATVARFFRRLLDYTVPVAALISGRRIHDSMQEAFGDRDIEDTWLPFFCVSTNLTRSRLEVHRRGELIQAVRASFSIPGVLPPVPYGEEDLLVDGGVLNNLPVDIARGHNPTGTVIASDVAPRLGPRARSDFGTYVSGTKVMARRLTPGLTAPRVPRLTATLMRSLLVAAAEQRDGAVAQGLADLHLELDLRGVGLLEFDRCTPVAQQGYEEAVGRLRDWADVTLRSPAPTKSQILAD